MFNYIKRKREEKKRKADNVGSSSDNSPNILTDPAYMGMPGNIYHTAISSPSYDSSSSSSCDSSSSGGSSDGGGSCGGGGGD